MTGLSQGIIYSQLGSQLTENFNLTGEDEWGSNATGSSSATWVDGVTIPAWNALYFNGNSGGSYTVPPTYIRSNGTQTTTANLYVFRLGDDRQNGALGAQQTDTITGTPANGGGVFFGVQIQNNTGVALTEFSLGYAGEQWRVASGGANTLTVSYSTDASAVDGVWLNTGSWTGVPDLTFTAPHSGAASSSLLDGNAAANRVVFAPQAITLASALAPGDSLYIRWFSANIGGVDQSLAIDDVTFSAIPEPSTYALLLGAALLGLAGFRRIRQNRG
jgi:hypothetical protein